MTGVPAGMKAEILFGASWTDVTSYTFGSVANIHYGRTSVFSDATAGTLSGITLDNTDGRFTPLCDLLLDGTTANPYYPNVLPRAQIRLSYTISTTTYYFYWGYIQSWPPSRLNGDGQPVVQITAVDGLGILNGIVITSGATASMLPDSPLALYPFNDPAGSTSWAELVSNNTAGPVVFGGSAGTYTLGSSPATAFADGLTGLQINALPAFSVGGWQAGKSTKTTTAANTTWTLEGWFTFKPDAATNDYSDIFLNVQSADGVTLLQLTGGTAGAGLRPLVYVAYNDPLNSPTAGPFQLTDDNPHFYAVTGNDNGTTLTLNFYVDGVLNGTGSCAGGSGTFGTAGAVTIFGQADCSYAISSPAVTFGPCAFYQTTLSAATVKLHYQGGAGGAGMTTGQRTTEMLRWFGISSAAVAAGIQTVTNHQVAGKTLLVSCQDMPHTEGGGSVFYNDPAAGQNTFLDRHYRSTTTPLFTVDAEADLDGPQFQPSFDSLTLVNQSTLQRPGGVSQTYSDAASIALYGVSTDQGGPVYPDTDGAVLNLAQERVNTQKNPAYRVGKLAIDLLTATTAGLYPLFGVMKIGSRLRVSNLVAAQTAPLTTADVYVEGWALTASADTFMLVIDTTPADNPPRGKWGTMRWGPVVGDALLNASITNSATALAIKWVMGPAWTVTSGSYPLIIQIDQEQIQLNGVPGGSTSPQSWTGVTRGVNGTRAAAHSANAVITMSPTYGNWQL